MDTGPSLYIREWRDERGLSQEDLAEKLGTSAGHISTMENQVRGWSRATLRKLADALEVAPWMLFLQPHEAKALALLMRVPEADKAKLMPTIEAFAEDGD